MLKWFADLWCTRMHRRAMWPVNGKYICSTCLREYPVLWERHWIEKTYRASRAGLADSSPSVAQAATSAVRNGFSKKCTSAAGMP